MKPTLCLDFDGVLHSYTSGWSRADEIRDPPVPGAMKFLKIAVEHFSVAIYSSRSGQEGGIQAMKAWIMKHLDGEFPPGLANHVFSELQWPTSKPSAKVTLDDRALTFTGVWPSIPTLLAFEPWNARERKRSA